MKNTMIDIFRGIIIGIANIVPGLSGGTLAVSMGIYETLINAVSNFFKEPINSIKAVWKYAVGMVIGVILSIFAVSYLFNLFPIPMTMLFIGLVLGSLPIMLSKVKGKVKIIDYIVCILLILLVLILTFYNFTTTSYNSSNILFMFVIGIIIAVTIVVPGISGSAVLMAIGCYTHIVDLAKNVIADILTFNIMEAITNGLVLIPLAFGVIIGVILTSKGIKLLLKRFPNTVYVGVIGLIISSPLPIIANLDFSNINIITIIVSIGLLIIGIFLTKIFSKNKEK